MSLKRKGFTLIELIMVLIILAALVAIALPTLVKMKARAIAGEAVIHLGMMRDALRTECNMYGKIASLSTDPGSSGDFLSSISNIALGKLGIPRQNFRGRYFDENCYKIVIADDTDINNPQNRVMAYVDPGAAGGTGDNSHRDDVIFMVDPGALGGYIVMYLKNGVIKQAGISVLGYPQDNLSAD